MEADKCAEIAREVSEKQASCERDLAAAEPLVQQAEAALDTLNKKDLGETKSLKKPPPGVQRVVMVTSQPQLVELMMGHHAHLLRYMLRPAAYIDCGCMTCVHIALCAAAIPAQVWMTSQRL